MVNDFFRRRGAAAWLWRCDIVMNPLAIIALKSTDTCGSIKLTRAAIGIYIKTYQAQRD